MICGSDVLLRWLFTYYYCCFNQRLTMVTNLCYLCNLCYMFKCCMLHVQVCDEVWILKYRKYYKKPLHPPTSIRSIKLSSLTDETHKMSQDGPPVALCCVAQVLVFIVWSGWPIFARIFRGHKNVTHMSSCRVRLIHCAKSNEAIPDKEIMLITF